MNAHYSEIQADKKPMFDNLSNIRKLVGKLAAGSQGGELQLELCAQIMALKNAAGIPNTRYLSFWHKLNLSNLDLSDLDLSSMNLKNVCFINSSLANSNLRGSSLAGCSFENCNLSHTDLSFAKLPDAIFQNANLYKTNIVMAYLEKNYIDYFSKTENRRITVAHCGPPCQNHQERISRLQELGALNTDEILDPSSPVSKNSHWSL
jgi:uncharacterized protein YjbI with pentapeptide repeats